MPANGTDNLGPRSGRHPLSDRQRLLVDEYFKDFNKGRALRAAGYSHATARGGPHIIFGHPAVMAEIERRRAKLSDKFELTEEWVIERLMRIADAGATLARFKVVQPDGALAWDFTGATEAELTVINELTVEEYVDGRGADARVVRKFRVSVSEPKGALDSLARRLGLFNDKLTLTDEMSLLDRLRRGRDRVAQAKRERDDSKDS